MNKTKLHREDHSVQIIIVAILLVIMIIGISEGMRTGSTTRKTDNRLPDHYLYYYDHMTDKQKAVYEILYMNYANLMDIPITETSDYELICDVWTYVKRDCPELYYVDALQSLRFTVGAKTIRKVGYTLYVPKEEQSAADERISQFVKGCQANISNTMTDYEKVELIIKYMCANITYQKDAPYDQCIYSAALGKCVCAGYSNMFKYLCDINNIPCVTVSGQLDGVNHAWNRTYLNGTWYYVDVTGVDNDSTGGYSWSYFTTDGVSFMKNRTLEDEVMNIK